MFFRNLLLPKGLGAERPWARFTVGVYRAEGLPTMEAGILASLSKASDRKVFINPYVQVDFAGQQVCGLLLLLRAGTALRCLL